MGFWIFLLVMDLLIPCAMLILGRRFQRCPPPMSAAYGYRTSRSMKSRAAWRFAQRYFGRLWFQLGVIMLPASAAAMLPALRWDVGAAGLRGGVLCLLQCVTALLAVPLTERALKRSFPEDGSRN